MKHFFFFINGTSMTKGAVTFFVALNFRWRNTAISIGIHVEISHEGERFFPCIFAVIAASCIFTIGKLNSSPVKVCRKFTNVTAPWVSSWTVVLDEPLSSRSQKTYLSKLNSCHEKDSTIWQEMKQNLAAVAWRTLSHWFFFSFFFFIECSMVLVMKILVRWLISI